MAKTQLKRTMEGAFILTLASFAAKILSAVYRVPFQNLVGDEGFYVYQQIYPIYGLAMTLALSGLPQFISRIVAESHGEKNQQQALKEIYPLVFWSAFGLWGLFFVFSKGLAEIMGNVALTPLIQVVSFTFLLVPPLSFYRGVFQGTLQMVPTAVSQVVEQLLRVGVILLAAFCFQRFSLSIYQTGTMAMAGAVFGGLLAWVVLRDYRKKITGNTLALHRFPLTRKPRKEIWRRFIIEGGLISIYSGFLILFQLIDSFLIANSLEAAGIAEQSARIAKGVYDRGQPLVQLGLVAATALGSTFFPTMTKYLSVKNQRLFQKSATMYLRLSVSLASGAACGLALLLPTINFALFKDGSGNATLCLFVLSVGLMGTIQAYQSIHQSRNYFDCGFKAAGIGLAVKCLTTWYLTLWFGTIGASISTLLGLAATLLCFTRAKDIQLNGFWKENRFWQKLVLCLGLMVAALLIYYGVAAWLLGSGDSRLQALVFSIIGVIVGGLAFILAALRLQLFTIREWLLLPFGKKILKFKGGKS